MSYQFQGWAAHEEEAARSLGLSPEDYLRNRVASDRALGECNSLAAQACNPGLTESQVADTLAASRRVRNSLAVALATADAVIDDVSRNLLPPPAQEPTPRRGRPRKDAAPTEESA